MNKEVNINEEKKKKYALVISFLVLMICIVGSTYAYFAITASNNSITGKVGGSSLDLTVTKILPVDNDDEMIPQLEGGLEKAISEEYNCVDGNGKVVCQVYSATVTNLGSEAVTLNGTIGFTGIENMPNLKWKLLTDSRTIDSSATSKNASTTETSFVENLSLTTEQTTKTKTYYFVFWIEETGELQTDNGEFRAIINFNSPNAESGVTSTITDEENLEPGLYKEDGTFISWEQLTSTEYQSFTYISSYTGNAETGAILNVDENGLLTSSFDYENGHNFSAEYLKGNLVIPESVTSIGDYAFYNCTGLTSITIPDSVTSISPGVSFYNCYSLASIIVDKNNSVYDSRDNSNAIIETSTNTLIIGCKNTIIPSSVTSIKELAFAERKGLTSITIPESVKSIGRDAFRYCTSLKSVYFEHTTAPTFDTGCFYRNSGDMCTFYFRNSAVSDALIAGTHYDSTYGTKSTNYDW